jgi:hypothetical protein
VPSESDEVVVPDEQAARERIIRIAVIAAIHLVSLCFMGIASFALLTPAYHATLNSALKKKTIPVCMYTLSGSEGTCLCM